MFLHTYTQERKKANPRWEPAKTSPRPENISVILCSHAPKLALINTGSLPSVPDAKSCIAIVTRQSGKEYRQVAVANPFFNYSPISRDTLLTSVKINKWSISDDSKVVQNISLSSSRLQNIIENFASEQQVWQLRNDGIFLGIKSVA